MKRWLFGALAVCLLLSGCRLDSAYETASFYYLDAGYADRMSDPIRKEHKAGPPEIYSCGGNHQSGTSHSTFERQIRHGPKNGILYP